MRNGTQVKDLAHVVGFVVLIVGIYDTAPDMKQIKKWNRKEKVSWERYSHLSSFSS